MRVFGRKKVEFPFKHFINSDKTEILLFFIQIKMSNNKTFRYKGKQAKISKHLKLSPIKTLDIKTNKP